MHLHSHKSDHNYDCRNALPMYDLLTRFFDTFSWHVPFLFLRQRMSPSPYVSLEYQESVPYDRMVHHQRLNKLSLVKKPLSPSPWLAIWNQYVFVSFPCTRNVNRRIPVIIYAKNFFFIFFLFSNFVRYSFSLEYEISKNIFWNIFQTMVDTQKESNRFLCCFLFVY